MEHSCYRRQNRVDVNGYQTAPPEHFILDHWNVQAQTAGHLDYVNDWTFHDVVLKTADDSHLTLQHSTDVSGLDTRENSAGR
jgi:hypothetical protein